MGAPSAAQAGTSGVVIIGAGQAGYQTAESLRQSGYEHPITLLGAEPHSPYSRPPLSKAYLLGETDQERLLFRAPAFYTDRNIDLRLNCTVAAIDRAAKTVTLAEGETLGYDHLVIATGATPRILPLPGAELEGVYSLKTLADVEQIEAALPGIESVAVIGAGFIGLEFAAVARKLGKAVTVLEAAPRVMGRVVPPELSAFFEAEHRAQDVTLHCEVRIEALLPGEDGRLGSIQLADGSQVPAQMVIVGIGVTPNVGLAEAAGLACDNGILVNDRCQTDDPAIFAAGDC
ncbi:MAG: NAD(P)/FAD-dependent oxidoreductase, partial [Rhodospirillaceae bacterium]